MSGIGTGRDSVCFLAGKTYLFTLNEDLSMKRRVDVVFLGHCELLSIEKLQNGSAKEEE